jgi:hypothetical protein
MRLADAAQQARLAVDLDGLERRRHAIRHPALPLQAGPLEGDIEGAAKGVVRPVDFGEIRTGGTPVAACACSISDSWACGLAQAGRPAPRPRSSTVVTANAGT